MSQQISFWNSTSGNIEWRFVRDYHAVLRLLRVRKDFVTHFVVLFVEEMREARQLVFERFGRLHVVPNGRDYLIFLQLIAANDEHGQFFDKFSFDCEISTIENAHNHGNLRENIIWLTELHAQHILDRKLNVRV